MMKEPHFKRKNHTGRSMIEMLGVLALIGVLSIGGIWGYKLAISRYQANETIKDVNLWASAVVEIKTRGEFGETIETQEVGHTSSVGYEINGVSAGNEAFAIEVVDVPQPVCEQMLKLAGETYLISLNGMTEEDGGSFYDGDDSVCEQNPDGTTFYFYFDNTLGRPRNYCLGTCSFSEVCCDNKCYPKSGLCGSKCACETGEECSNGVCCLENIESCNGTCCSNSTQVCREGICQCPENSFLNSAGQCVCSTGYTLDPKTKKCVGLCCEGTTCYVGATDANNCQTGKRCGYQCDSSGTNCSHGLCTNQCPAGTSYAWNEIKNVYGCYNQSLGTFCTKDAANYIYCYFYTPGSNTIPQCGFGCQLSGSGCGGGSCQNNCPAGYSFGPTICSSGYGGIGKIYGCQSNTSNLAYFISSSGGIYNWCKSDGTICGYGCNESTKTCARGNCFDADFCPSVQTTTTLEDGTTVESKAMKIIKGAYGCENPNNTYCIGLNHSMGYHGMGQCKFTSTISGKVGVKDEVCGQNCLPDSSDCNMGNCDQTCESGYDYVRIGVNLYGCQRKNTNIACRRYLSSYYCYKKESNGTYTACATGCNYDGSSCSSGSCDVEYACPDNGILSDDKGSCSYNNIVCFTHLAVNGQSGRCYNSYPNFCCTSSTATPYACDEGECLPSVANCPTGWIFGAEAYMGGYGCISTGNPKIACVKSKNTYTCYKDNSQCGTGCAKDGTGCTSGDCSISQDDQTCADSCANAGLVYNAYSGGVCYCSPADTNIKCVGGSGSSFDSCSLSNSVCGTNCENTNSGLVCAVGECVDNCSNTATFGSVNTATSGSVYGCTNKTTSVRCYKVAENDAYTCLDTNNNLIGTNCSDDGYCP